METAPVENLDCILEIPEGSEDELKFSDDDEIDYDDAEAHPQQFSTITEFVSSSVHQTDQTTSSPSYYLTSKIMKHKNDIWRKESHEFDKNKILINEQSYSDEILALESPLDFFRYFFKKELLEMICNESVKYAEQKDANSKFTLTVQELEQYLGICVLMSIIHLPDVRSYWSPNIGNHIIIDCMNNKRFEKIRQFIHFNDNTAMKPIEHPDHDRLFRLRPVFEYLQERFKSVPIEESLSIDEQLCSTKARHLLLQHMPTKPHKWGYKLFALCGVSGYVYSLEIYTGQENDLRKDLESKARSYCKKQKPVINYSRPNMVEANNIPTSKFGLHDSFVGRYRIRMRSKKWYMRLFYHLIDITVVNAWLLSRRISNLERPPISLAKFREKLGIALCKAGKKNLKRPKDANNQLETSLQSKKSRKPGSGVPLQEIRQDGIDHLPQWNQTRQRCKLPNCKGSTYSKCSKCSVSLCYNKNKNCFLMFHTS